MSKPQTFIRIALLASIMPLGGSLASGPAWWLDRGVLKLDPQTKEPVAADDYYLLNQGQLKHFATQAAAEFDLRLPGGAGIAIHALVDPWLTDSSMQQAQDYTALNVGQLKNIAKVFYDRLAQEGYNDPPKIPGQTYLWTPNNAADDDDFRYANIGQAKHLFSFDLATDTDGDAVPDWRERANGTDPTDDSDGLREDLQDDDEDGVPNGVEVAQGTDPHNPDSDGDGFWDGADAAPNDPLVQLTATSGDTHAPTIKLVHPVAAP